MKKLIVIIFIFSTILTLGCGNTISGEKILSNKKWEEDINNMDENLRKKHPDLFRCISEKTWNENIQKLNSDLKNLSDIEISMRISQIISSIGDAHTSIDFLEILTPIGKEKFSYDEIVEFPIKFDYFSNELRAIASDSQYKSILGYKLISINNVCTDEIIKKVSTLISYDNQQFAKELARSQMQIYEYLKFLQIVDGTKAEYLFENDNKEKIKINVNAIKNKEVNYVNLDKTQSKISTKVEGKYDFYWTKQMKEDNVLYFKYNKCLTNQGPNIDKHGSANYPDYYDFHNDLLEEINNNNYEKLVIDLRQNRGGAFKLVDLLIHDLKYKINLNSEDIVVITGKETLSAGAILAWRLQNELGATIIGEETGGNVNMFGTEGEFITLPNSKIKVKHPYSFRELKEGYNGGVKPDVEIKQTYKNYINGIDDCYEYVVNVLKK